MRTLKFFMAGLFLAMFTSIGLAADRPNLRIGDSFTFEGNNSRRQWTITVTGVQDNLVEFTTRDPGGGWMSTVVTTPELNWVQERKPGGEGNWSPARQDFVFPLTPQSHWEQSYVYNGPKGRYDRHRSCHVEKEESFIIRSSNESLDTLKVSCTDSSGNWSGKFDYWYAPRLGYVVKLYSKEFRADSQLVDYKHATVPVAQK